MTLSRSGPFCVSIDRARDEYLQVDQVACPVSSLASSSASRLTASRTWAMSGCLSGPSGCNSPAAPFCSATRSWLASLTTCAASAVAHWIPASDSRCLRHGRTIFVADTMACSDDVPSNPQQGCSMCRGFSSHSDWRKRAPMEVKGHNGTVNFDGDFVTITRKGFVARATIGKGEKRIPLNSITAVQWKPAGTVMNGFISFTLGGGNEARSGFGSQTIDASKDENSVIFVKKQMPDFDALRSQVEQAIVARHRPATPSPSTPDNLVQLKQLGELRDSGILSEDEFAAKKAEILGRI